MENTQEKTTSTAMSAAEFPARAFENDDQAKAYFIEHYGTERCREVCLQCPVVDEKSEYKSDVYDFIAQSDLTEREKIHCAVMYAEAKAAASNPLSMLSALMRGR